MSYAKLRGAIREKFCTHKAFADALGMREATLSSRLNGGTQWTRDEIQVAMILLEEPPEKTHLYFF